MDENQRIALNRQILKVLFFITLIICVPPLALYLWARVTGSLPSEAEWGKVAGNSGPWLDKTQGGLLFLSFLAMLGLPSITSLFVLAMCIETKGRRLLTFGQGIALVILQFAIGFALWSITSWTISDPTW